MWGHTSPGREDRACRRSPHRGKRFQSARGTCSTQARWRNADPGRREQTRLRRTGMRPPDPETRLRPALVSQIMRKPGQTTAVAKERTLGRASTKKSAFESLLLSRLLANPLQVSFQPVLNGQNEYFGYLVGMQSLETFDHSTDSAPGRFDRQRCFFRPFQLALPHVHGQARRAKVHTRRQGLFHEIVGNTLGKQWIRRVAQDDYHIVGGAGVGVEDKRGVGHGTSQEYEGQKDFSPYPAKSI